MLGLTLVLTTLSWAAAVAPSQASSLAANVQVALSPTTVVADGSSTVIATATVTDAGSNPVAGDTVAFTSSDPNQQIGSVSDNGDGTYTATITSSTTAGTPTITATDSSVNPSIAGYATLTQTAGPAQAISVQVAPASVIANGVLTATATATITDGHGNPVIGDAVAFSSSDAGEQIGPVSDHFDGTYTATITSSTTAGIATITATDNSVNPNISGGASLAQTAGPAQTVSVSLAPTTIPADGASTTSVTATVRDGHGNPVAGDSIHITSSDPNQNAGSVTDNGNGTYTATLTASWSPGASTITATDSSASSSPSGQATLVQIATSATGFVATPANPTTNQPVGLVATVSSSAPNVLPAGAVTFTRNGSPVSGCANLPLTATGQSATITCAASFGAGTSQLAAVFTSTNANLMSSGSPASTVAVGPDATVTGLDVTSPSIGLGKSVTYVAIVSPRDAGAVAVSGSVQFTDNGQPIASCLGRPLSGSSPYVATCTVQYAGSGSHAISARYSGDANFTASTSQPAAVTAQAPPVPVLGAISATMQWTFYYSPAYSRVLALRINGLPFGSSVVVLCRGKGCPFARRTTSVVKGPMCKTVNIKSGTKARCSPPSHTVDLTKSFAHRRLKPGARITIEIARPGWIGKYYAFKMIAHGSPSVQIRCLAPGASKPGIGC